MYSVIIPTMLKSPRLLKLIYDLQNSQYVDEIIIIDNSGNTQPSLPPHPKQKYICEGKNTGCNPAWNKGVELAKNEKIALVNDDINFNTDIFGLIDDAILSQVGIIGQGGGNYNQNQDKNPYIDMWAPGINDWGWGCLIFLTKKNWIPIPDGLFLWYGDNFMKEINPASVGVLRGFRVDTEMSTTSDLPEFDSPKHTDGIIWRQNYNKWKQHYSK